MQSQVIRQLVDEHRLATQSPQAPALSELESGRQALEHDMQRRIVVLSATWNRERLVWDAKPPEITVTKGLARFVRVNLRNTTETPLNIVAWSAAPELSRPLTVLPGLSQPFLLEIGSEQENAEFTFTAAEVERCLTLQVKVAPTAKLLVRLLDGDTHIHWVTNSWNVDLPLADLALVQRAEALRVANNLTLLHRTTTDAFIKPSQAPVGPVDMSQFAPPRRTGFQPVTPEPSSTTEHKQDGLTGESDRPDACPTYHIEMAEEYRNQNLYGHLCFLNLQWLVLPIGTGPQIAGDDSLDYPLNKTAIIEARGQGGISIEATAYADESIRRYERLIKAQQHQQADADVAMQRDRLLMQAAFASHRGHDEGVVKQISDAAHVGHLRMAAEPFTLLQVHINPESRVKLAIVTRPEIIVQHRTQRFLVEIHNKARIQAPLRIRAIDRASLQPEQASWCSLRLLENLLSSSLLTGEYRSLLKPAPP